MGKRAKTFVGDCSSNQLKHDSVPFFPLELSFTKFLLQHVQKISRSILDKKVTLASTFLGFYFKFYFYFFFSFPFSPFLIFLAAMIDLLLGLLACLIW